MYYIRDIIKKKREKKELTEEEIRFFIFSYFRDEILEEQAAALLTLIYTNGITSKEMAYLTNAMAETGEEIELYKISNKIVDFHPIGGIEDKIAIMLMCIIASLGIPIAKIAGRELGLEARLSAIPNYPIKTDFNKLQQMVENTNIGIMAEPINIAPVEEKLYRLRNCIACSDDISLITMSIMSQKISIGARNIIFDITCGENAYVKTYADAKKMANYLISIGKNINRNVKCIISSMNEPIGSCFGNLLEIDEVIEALCGNMTKDVMEMIETIGTKMLQIIGITNNERECKRLIYNSIESGQAYQYLCKFLNYQEVEINLIRNRTEAKCIVPIIANVEGYVKEINVSAIRSAGIFLNAIKRKKEDKLDRGAGIRFCKKVGDKVQNGEILAYVYTNDETKVRKAINDIGEAYKFSEKKILNKSRILGIIE